MKKSEIKFTITFDDKKIPEKINWDASDIQEQTTAANAVMIALWDAKEKNTLRIDLWTKEMMVEEMQRFVYDTISSLATTYSNATNDEVLSKELRDFSVTFGKKAGVIG